MFHVEVFPAGAGHGAEAGGGRGLRRDSRRPGRAGRRRRLLRAALQGEGWQPAAGGKCAHTPVRREREDGWMERCTEPRGVPLAKLPPPFYVTQMCSGAISVKRHRERDASVILMQRKFLGLLTIYGTYSMASSSSAVVNFNQVLQIPGFWTSGLLWFCHFLLSVFHNRTSCEPVGVKEFMFWFRLLPFMGTSSMGRGGSGGKRKWGRAPDRARASAYFPLAQSQLSLLSVEKSTCFPSHHRGLTHVLDTLVSFVLFDLVK
ncbi:uncharacterized protein LOC128092118 [Tympanuchus pallidicinctus]|uniref:uncharacterized protein LOC128092118 n=1 Tax=Tympanuchus pallidicinctus TaxID=109042 RepID=UPI0022872293|nr:uncharacterized protein LOC128092118 [Tympanuchus pallidicinctus]